MFKRRNETERNAFTPRKGLASVRYPRAEWDAIKDMTAEPITRTVLDTTLPTGPVERTLTYQAPFTKRNRKQDYAMVWVVLDVREGKA